MKKPTPHPPKRSLYLLQRSSGKLGAKLGKTTGWIHRAQLKAGAVEMISEVTYEHLSVEGLQVTVKGTPRLLEVDSVVVCAGQLSDRSLCDSLDEAGLDYTLIGGALRAGEVDAKRAIAEGYRAALDL